MGVCESVKRINKNKKHQIKNKINSTNISNNSFNNSIKATIKGTNFYIKNDYILNEDFIIHDDINKYYNIKSKILGKGLSGKVFIGIKNNIKYAIKRINKHKIHSINSIKREIKFSQIKHENLIKYYEIFEDEDYISIVMELGEYGDLFDLIFNFPLNYIPLDICIDLFIQILDIINFLHKEKKIVHRDLKPENFIIKLDENKKIKVKLIDFGLATFVPEGEYSLTDKVGTSSYLAPEIVSGFGYDEKIDIWSLGVILYNLLTGSELFIGESKNELYDEIKYKPINFDIIEYEPIKKLCQKMLYRIPLYRINSENAFEIIKEIKSERIELLKNVDNEKNIKNEYQIFNNYFNEKKKEIEINCN